MREQFIEWKPNASTQLLLVRILQVLEVFKNQGYWLTLRQLYYQLVARDYVPNSVKSYNRIGNVVNNGRLSGIIDWSMIEDRVRRPSVRGHWTSTRDILSAAANQYYKDHWVGQQNYVEVWCEKDAVSNIIEPVCKQWDVLFMANRGYTFQTAMYDAFQRYSAARSEDKELHLIYLGDHDPSGMDMTRDIEDRMGLFLYFNGYFDEVHSFDEVDRVALNIDQIKRYKPPENPAKQTDSRFGSYVTRYGMKSWELDALSPSVLASIVNDAIAKYVDVDKWQAVEQEQIDERDEALKKIDEIN